MKDKTYFLNTVLALVLGIGGLACVLVRAFLPHVILPELNVTNMVLLSLIALVADHYLAPNAKRCYICIPVLSAVSFGLLPFAAGLATVGQALRLALVGGVTFAVTTWLFSSIQDRLSTGPAAKAAPAVSALGLYLAAQCLMGMIL